MKRTSRLIIQGKHHSRKKNIIYSYTLLLSLMIFVGYYVYWISFMALFLNNSSQSTLMEGDNWQLQIDQGVFLSNDEELSRSPLPSAQNEIIFTERFNSLTQLSSSGHITLDSTRKMEGYSSLYMSLSRCNPPNVYITPQNKVKVDSDETFDISFYYYMQLEGLNKNPYLIMRLTLKVNNQLETIGIVLYGSAKDTSIDKITRIQNITTNIWTAVNLQDIRGVLKTINDVKYGTNLIEITKIALVMGDKNYQSYQYNIWWDYLTINTKPVVIPIVSGWYDTDNQLVSFYQISTSFSFYVLKDMYNITTEGVFCPVEIYIVNYVDINKIARSPIESTEYDVIDNMLVYMVSINLMVAPNLLITETEINDSPCYQINGSIMSNPIQLQDNLVYGYKLQYEFMANYTIYAQQLDEQWQYATLDEWIDVFSFVVEYKGQSLFI